jgi:hypothetical protein
MAKFVIPKIDYNNGYGDRFTDIVSWCSQYVSPLDGEIIGDDVLFNTPVKIRQLKVEYHEFVTNDSYAPIWSATKRYGDGWRAIIVHYTDHTDIGYIQIVVEIVDDTLAVLFKLAMM